MRSGRWVMSGAQTSCRVEVGPDHAQLVEAREDAHAVRHALAQALLPALLRDVDGQVLEQLVRGPREVAGEGLLVAPPLEQAHARLHGARLLAHEGVALAHEGRVEVRPAVRAQGAERLHGVAYD